MWIKTQMKPKKRCTENPIWPLSRVFTDINWELSGGTKHVGIIAAAMICAYDINTVLEIGIWNAFTTKLFGQALSASAMEKGLLVSIDINPRAIERAKEAVKHLPIKHKVVLADTNKFEDFSMYLEGKKAGLIFIDGDHSYESALNDLKKSDKVLAEEGIIIVHDYSKNQNHKGVVKAVDEYLRGWPMFFLPENRISTDYRTIIVQKPWRYR